VVRVQDNKETDKTTLFVSNRGSTKHPIFRLGRQLGKPHIAHKDRSRRSLNETLDDLAGPDPGSLDTRIECDEENKTCSKSYVNPAGNPVRSRAKKSHDHGKLHRATAKKRNHATSKRAKIVKREIRNVRTKRHVKITEEEDFDVRLCQANRNGTICPEGIDQGRML